MEKTIKNQADFQYINLLKDILENGHKKDTRAGKVISKFGHAIKLNTYEQFPLLNCKKMYWNGILYELLWFLKGDTNIKYLLDNKVHIWDADAYRYYKTMVDDPIEIEEFIENVLGEKTFTDKYGQTVKYGELGNIYGFQWNKKNEITGESQLDYIDRMLRMNPDDRRMLCSAWNYSDLPLMGLPPCHVMWCVHTDILTHEERVAILDELNTLKVLHKHPKDMTEGELDDLCIPRRRLNLSWTQRSVDTFLGLPFNIASYGLLQAILASRHNMICGELMGNLIDCHIYEIHLDAVNQLLNDEKRTACDIEAPIIVFNDHSAKIQDTKPSGIHLLNYKPHGTIKAPLCVG